MGSIQRNAQGIEKLSKAVLDSHEEMSKDEYSIFVDKMAGYMNRISSLFDNDLNGKFSEMSAEGNY